MPNVMMAINDALAPSARRAKPKLVLTGIRRHAVRKLLHYLRVVDRQDTKEAGLAEEKGYTPFLYVDRLNGPIGDALGLLIQRCLESLALKV